MWLAALVPCCVWLLLSTQVPDLAIVIAGCLGVSGLALLWQMQTDSTQIKPVNQEWQLDQLQTYVICELDKDVRIERCFGNTQTIFGLASHEIASGTPIQTYLGSFDDELPSLFTMTEFSLPIRQNDGQLILGQFNVCPRNNGFLAIIRDVTEDIAIQGELSERARELHTVFNTIGDPVFLIDLDGIIRNANEAARSIYPNGKTGDFIYDTVRQEDEPSIEDPIQRCLAHFQAICAEQHLQHQNRTVQIHIYPILNAKNKIRQLLYMEHDITNERLMELEVRLQHQKLQDNYRRLRELDEAKTQWLNSVSHELRTPLTSIRSFSELLLTYDDTEPATRREFLEIIVKESERLSRLINDMLDLARIESGSMPWHPKICDLVEMTNETCNTLRSIADKQDIYFQVKSSQQQVRIHTDSDRLKQVLVNVISNAIKFSPDGHPINISIDADEEDVRFAIEDDGPGIPPSDRQQIFERFSQGSHDLTEKPHGTGLGLTISHHIIKFMGGQIQVSDPVELQGARFVVSIPRAISDVNTQDLAV